MSSNTKNAKYESFLKYAYELYKHEWCEERGYDIENWSEEFGFGGESFVSMVEFEGCEYADEEYMEVLLPNAGFLSYWKQLQKIRQESDSVTEECFCVEVVHCGTVEIIAKDMDEARLIAPTLSPNEFFWNDEIVVTKVFPCKPS